MARQLALEPLEARIVLATFLWQGDAGDSLWSTGANWVGDTAPAGSGHTLVFDDTTAGFADPAGLSTNNDIAGLTDTTLRFSESTPNNFVVGGAETVGLAVSGTGIELLNGFAWINTALSINDTTFNSSGGYFYQWGVISGTNGLTIDGGNDAYLYASNTFTGDVTVQGNSELNPQNGANIPDASSVHVDAGSQFAVQASETIDGLTGAGQVVAVSNASLTVGGNDGGGTFSGVIRDNNAPGDITSLTKIGTGTQTLSGANTYTGATTINAGTLLVNGSTAAGSVVAVNNGGTLGGTGTVSGPVNVNAFGTIAPGLSPGTINTGNLNFTHNSTFNVEIDAGPGQFDVINVTGTVAMDLDANDFDFTGSGIGAGLSGRQFVPHHQQ